MTQKKHYKKITHFLYICLLSMPLLANAAPGAPVILAFGDSLTDGYGLAREQAWPALLQKQINEAGLHYRVVNAGVSGETTAGGLARLPQTLAREKPRIVMLELGANDGLRGLSLQQARSNLARMIALSKAAGAWVLLIGMQIPTNYGPAYAGQFRQMYSELARQYHVALLPFLLNGVALAPKLNLPDGLHPNAQGQRIVAQNVWHSLEPMLNKEKQSAYLSKHGHRHEQIR